LPKKLTGFSERGRPRPHGTRCLASEFDDLAL
jgi:hypothetical protein